MPLLVQIAPAGKNISSRTRRTTDIASTCIIFRNNGSTIPSQEPKRLPPPSLPQASTSLTESRTMRCGNVFYGIPEVEKKKIILGFASLNNQVMCGTLETPACVPADLPAHQLMSSAFFNTTNDSSPGTTCQLQLAWKWNGVECAHWRAYLLSLTRLSIVKSPSIYQEPEREERNAVNISQRKVSSPSSDCT